MNMSMLLVNFIYLSLSCPPVYISVAWNGRFQTIQAGDIVNRTDFNKVSCIDVVHYQLAIGI